MRKARNGRTAPRDRAWQTEEEVAITKGGRREHSRDKKDQRDLRLRHPARAVRRQGRNTRRTAENRETRTAEEAPSNYTSAADYCRLRNKTAVSRSTTPPLHTAARARLNDPPLSQRPTGRQTGNSSLGSSGTRSCKSLRVNKQSDGVTWLWTNRSPNIA